MKKNVLISTLVLSSMSLLASGGFVPPAEFVEFLEKGDAHEFIGAHQKTSLDTVKKWAQAFPSLNDFAQFFTAGDANKTTILGKFAGSSEPEAVEVLEYLLEECGADPEFGAAHSTPLEVADQSHNQDAKQLFYETILRRLMVAWDSKGDAQPLVEFFQKRTDAKVAFDQLVIPQLGNRTATDVLSSSPRRQAADRILAYAAPTFQDGVDALKSAVVGCCEYDEAAVPFDLLKAVLKKHQALVIDQDGLEKYLEEKLADDQTKVRTELVCAELKTYYQCDTLTPEARAKKFWVVHPADDAVVVRLLHDCLTHDGRQPELEQYLVSLGTQRLSPAALPYDGYESFAHYVDADPSGVFPAVMKSEVERLIEEHNERTVPCKLFEQLRVMDPLHADASSKRGAFIDYVIEYSLDIDTIDSDNLGVCLGEYLPANDQERAMLDPVYQALECYRSEPHGYDQLRDQIDAILGGVQLDTLSPILYKRTFNIDLIESKQGGESIAQMLESHRVVPAQAILTLPGIQSFRSEANAQRRLFEKALAGSVSIEDFEAAYQAYDVDEMLMGDGKTLGQYLSEALASQNKNALEVARVVHNDRSDKDAVVRALFAAWEKDHAAFDSLKAWVEKGFNENIDYIECEVGNRLAIGERITQLLATDRAAVVKVALLFQPNRTMNVAISEQLINEWEHDRSKFADLKAWLESAYFGNLEEITAEFFELFEKDPAAAFDGYKTWFTAHPIDVDVAILKTKTVKRHIEKLFASQRKEALRVAELVQPKRSNKEAFFKFLFAEFEKDATLLNDLKSWVSTVDVDTLDYDGTQTYRQKIDSLNNESLSKIFAKAPVPQPTRGPQDLKKAIWWTTPKKVGAVILAGSALAWYWYKKGANTRDADQQTKPASAAA